MGYTTNFEGEFKFDRQLTHQEAGVLRDLYDAERGESRTQGAPDAYLQWVVGDDRHALRYDGNEKFYEYIPWLKFLIETHFEPWGVKLSGTVLWQGEDVTDIGMIIVKDNAVRIVEKSHIDPETVPPGQVVSDPAQLLSVLEDLQNGNTTIRKALTFIVEWAKG